jgi:hypothetical protein
MSSACHVFKVSLSIRIWVLDPTANKKALNQLKEKFGKLAIVVYVYSQITREEYLAQERIKQKKSHHQNDEKYLQSRAENFDMSWKIYAENFLLFDHVLIYANRQEDLFDQIFRLFKAYEKGLIR